MRPLFLLALAACAADKPEPFIPVDPCDLADPLVATVGTGEVDFEAIEGGETLPQAPGPQGCCHVWGSLLLEGAEPGLAAFDVYFAVNLTLQLLAPDGTPLGGIDRISPSIAAETEEGFDVAGITVFVDDPDNAGGLDAELVLTVEDACLRTAEDRVPIVIGDKPVLDEDEG
jgi:hypothetical protein